MKKNIRINFFIHQSSSPAFLSHMHKNWTQLVVCPFFLSLLLLIVKLLFFSYLLILLLCLICFVATSCWWIKIINIAFPPNSFPFPSTFPFSFPWESHVTHGIPMVPIPIHTSPLIEGSVYAKTSLVRLAISNRTPTCDKQTDGQRTVSTQDHIQYTHRFRPHSVDLLWICSTICRTTDLQQNEPVEFEPYRVKLLHMGGGCG